MMYVDEAKDYEAQGRPVNHIYLDLVILQELEQEYKNKAA